MMYRVTHIPGGLAEVSLATPWGRTTVLVTDAGLCAVIALRLEGHLVRDIGADHLPELAVYFGGPLPEPDAPKVPEPTQSAPKRRSRRSRSKAKSQ